jgi:acyl-coenzyme A thioesterase PaaI-like protein
VSGRGGASATELRRVLAGARFTRHYGFRMESVGDGECTVRVRFRAALERPGGIVSGPAFMAASDAAMWLAVMTRLGPHDLSVTSEMHTAFLAAARREGFRARARVLRWGNRLVYGVAECVSDSGILLAHSTLTYRRLGSGTNGRFTGPDHGGESRGAAHALPDDGQSRIQDSASGISGTGRTPALRDRARVSTSLGASSSRRSTSTRR